MRLSGAPTKLKLGSLNDHRTFLLHLAQARLLGSGQAIGPDLLRQAERHVAERLSPLLSEDACPRLTFQGGRSGMPVARLTYNAPTSWYGVDSSWEEVTPGLRWSAYAQLSDLTRQLYPRVWTPWNAWQYYCAHQWTPEEFRRYAARELCVLPEELPQEDLLHWAELNSLHDPWTVMGQLRLPSGLKPWPLPRMEREAQGKTQFRLVRLLTELRRVVRAMPAGRNPSADPLPTALLIPHDDSGVTLEYAHECLAGSRLSHSLECQADLAGLRDLKRYLRRFKDAQQLTEDVLELFSMAVV